jgi:hypothetical protein
MNYSSLGLATLGGTVASFAFGFLVFWLVPGNCAVRGNKKRTSRKQCHSERHCSCGSESE